MSGGILDELGAGSIMDYRGWVERSGRFVGDFKRLNPGMKARFEVEPPATPEQVVQVEEAIGRRLPNPIRSFLLSASSGHDFGYWWKPRGEAQAEAAMSSFGTGDIAGGLEAFCHLAYIADDYQHCQELAEEESWGDQPFCKDPLPFGTIGNGDYLAFDLASDEQNPRVVYLAHDDPSFILASDFDAFLTSWEAICYLNPALDRPFSQFVDKEGRGMISADTPVLRRLKELLLPAS